MADGRRKVRVPLLERPSRRDLIDVTREVSLDYIWKDMTIQPLPFVFSPMPLVATTIPLNCAVSHWTYLGRRRFGKEMQVALGGRLHGPWGLLKSVRKFHGGGPTTSRVIA